MTGSDERANAIKIEMQVEDREAYNRERLKRRQEIGAGCGRVRPEIEPDEEDDL